MYQRQQDLITSYICCLNLVRSWRHTAESCSYTWWLKTKSCGKLRNVTLVTLPSLLLWLRVVYASMLFQLLFTPFIADKYICILQSPHFYMFLPRSSHASSSVLWWPGPGLLEWPRHNCGCSMVYGPDVPHQATCWHPNSGQCWTFLYHQPHGEISLCIKWIADKWDMIVCRECEYPESNSGIEF